MGSVEAIAGKYAVQDEWKRGETLNSDFGGPGAVRGRRTGERSVDRMEDKTSQ